MNKTNLQIIGVLRQFLIQGHSNKSKYCNRPEDFSRVRKLSFMRVVVFIINLPRKSLSIELGEFYEKLGLPALLACTKGAFSRARKKLKCVFFVDWNKELLREYYTDNEQRVKKWLGHEVFGIDGSTAYLFNDKAGKIEEYFGRMSGVIMGRIMNCVDVLNGLCIKASISPIGVSEMEIAKKWVEHFKQEFAYIEHPLLLFDRGFAGFALTWILMQAGVDFVVRYPLGFNQMVYDFMHSDLQDCIVQWGIPVAGVKELQALGYEVDKHTSIKVRLVKVLLDTGEVEVLVTSLLDQDKYAREEFKSLYFLRWGTEIQYDYWKNKAQVEIVSGHSVQAILQDFHATVFTANLHSLVISECEPEVEAKNERCKHDYAVNKNVGLGFLKGRIVKMFLLQEPEKIVQELKLLFIKHVEPLRPGRKNKREFKVHKVNGKYATFTNYRRAI